MCFVSEIFIFPFIDEGLVFAWSVIKEVVCGIKELVLVCKFKTTCCFNAFMWVFLCCMLSFVSILVFLGENDDVLLLLSICQEGCLFDVAIDLGVMGNACITKLFVA